jgi:acyl carrier protein
MGDGAEADWEDLVIRELREVAPDTAWSTHTPLFGDGQLDSLGLVLLVTWVEQRIGRRIDPAGFDLPLEWATVGAVAAFIARHAGRPANV